MWNYIKFLLAASFLANNIHIATSSTYNHGGSSGNIPIDTGYTGGQTPPIILDGIQDATFLGATGNFRNKDASGIGSNLGIANQINLDRFASDGSRRVTDFEGFGQDRASGINLGGSGSAFSQPAFGGTNIGGSGVQFARPAIGGSGVQFARPAIGGINLGGSGVGSGQLGIDSFRAQGAGLAFAQAPVGVPGFNVGGGFGSGRGATRVIEAPATPTVTRTVTIDHFVTLTDLAFHSVPVTLTDLVLRTTTVTSRQAIHTPIDDRVALQTSVIVRPTSLTVTCTKHDYRIATEVAVDYVTITHTSYIIRQTTYTTTATQVSTYAATMVRTIIHTQRTTVTDYHTITNTVHGQDGGYYY